MDPEACLLAWQSAIEDREWDLASDCDESYRDWRASGGFEPMIGCLHGDAFAAWLRRLERDARA